MEDQLVGKPFWHPDASRAQAEQLMANGKHGTFIIRRSSNPGCLALSHKLADSSFGHALIQWNGSGYSLEQTTQSYGTIEALIRSLDLRLEDVKKNRPRPSHALGRPVLYQVEAITNYNAQGPDELNMHRGDVVNVIGIEGGWLWGELDNVGGKFPSGLTKKVPGSEAPPGGGGGGPPGMGPGPGMMGPPPGMQPGMGFPPGRAGPPPFAGGGGGGFGPPGGGGGQPYPGYSQSPAQPPPGRFGPPGGGGFGGRPY